MLYRMVGANLEARQFLGHPIAGAVRLPPQRIDASHNRGITYNRPERWVVNTPTAQIEIAQGDWIVTGHMGEHYVFKADVFHLYFKEAGTLEKLRHNIRRWRP